MTELNKAITTRELADKIDDLARITADGFASVDKRFEQVDKRFEQVASKQELAEVKEELDGRFDSLEQRFGIMERKLDRVLYDELDRHERWIKPGNTTWLAHRRPPFNYKTMFGLELFNHLPLFNSRSR